jgi:hypothetical protein
MDRNQLNRAESSRNPNRPAQIPLRTGGKHLKQILTGGAYASDNLTAPNRYATDGSRSNGSQASSNSARQGSPAFAGTSVRRRGLDGEEAGVDGDDAERRRLLDSSSWHRRRVQRRPDAMAPPASSSSPAELATSNGEEMGEEEVSGRLLGAVRVQLGDRRGFI